MDLLRLPTLKWSPFKERIMADLDTQEVLVGKVGRVAFGLYRRHLKTVLFRYVLLFPVFLLHYGDIVADFSQINSETTLPIFIIGAWPSNYLLR